MTSVLEEPRLTNPYSGLASYQLYIGGAWVDARSGKSFTSTNPTTGLPWAEVAEGGADDIDAAVKAARAAFENGWRETSAAQRAALLRRLADVLSREDVVQRLAVHELLDTGKVIRETIGLARAFSGWCYYYAGLAESFGGSTNTVPMDETFTYTVPGPLGVVGAITPWNSPIFLMLWKLCPALAAGNTIVIKPSEVAPVSTLEFARVLEEVGFPPGVVNVVSGGRDAGAALASHPDVDKVAFTGSTATGRSVMHAAADNLTRVSLELGGKSPNIVFGDADLDLAVNGILSGGFAAGGQMCTAGSRVLLDESVYDEVIDRLVARVRAIKIGDPFDWGSEMGALTWADQYASVLRRIETAQEQGARLVTGGGRPDPAPTPRGFYVAPTVLVDVRPTMELAREEIFGPVVGIVPFKTEAEAISIANDTPYGLAAAVWTTNLGRTQRMVKAVRAGTVWVNCYRRVSYAAPFGGVKTSGLGHENGIEVMREYTETKTVWIDTNADARDPFRLA
ncbi:aldehyde dehydrogenase [Nocardioides sp. LS1]|uniref:aldehyde dehydrogenase n=1 Tax=Nocardioides sp. LS1 TaxID=1027620 RepID=UPI000FF9216F|nr:aldehyde dehydrogenase [Nocardioides sp. LS1]GCD91111.1 aldehyde dehydrogenase [Nocardioides sp. LS1]